MAGRKMKAPKTSSSEAHAFVVVLEEMRSHFKVFGEGLQLLREQIDGRFEQVDRRFEQVDRRFDRVEHDIAEIRQDVGLVKIAVLDHSRELKEIRVGLDKKVDRDEVEGIVQHAIARSR